MSKLKRRKNTTLYISAAVFVLGMTFSGLIWGHAPSLDSALFFTTIAVIVVVLEIKETSFKFTASITAFMCIVPVLIALVSPANFFSSASERFLANIISIGVGIPIGKVVIPIIAELARRLLKFPKNREGNE